MGKTIALRALCYEEQVKKAYSDGICFLEFGEDADDRKVIKQVARCVLDFAGRDLPSCSLSEALYEFATWLRSKAVLLICDDLCRNKNKYAYLHNLIKLLRHAPRSSLVIAIGVLRIVLMRAWCFRRWMSKAARHVKFY